MAGIKVKNIVLTTIVAAGAAALAARAFMKDSELAKKAKEEGKKVLDDAKVFGSTMKEATMATVDEIKVAAEKAYEDIKAEVKAETEDDSATEEESTSDTPTDEGTVVDTPEEVIEEETTYFDEDDSEDDLEDLKIPDEEEE